MIEVQVREPQTGYKLEDDEVTFEYWSLKETAYFDTLADCAMWLDAQKWIDKQNGNRRRYFRRYESERFEEAL